jgi:hypothetical protein
LPGDRFELGQSKPGSAPSLERVGLRRALLEQFDATRRDLEKRPRIQGYDRHEITAYEMLTNSTFSRALDIQQEPEPVRQAYGMN